MLVVEDVLAGPQQAIRKSTMGFGSKFDHNNENAVTRAVDDRLTRISYRYLTLNTWTKIYLTASKH